MSVAVARRGQVIYAKGVGFADLEKNIPVTPDIRFPVGSITKSFTCLSTQQLVADGKVDINKTAGDYLPDLPAPDRSVKVLYLLTHTSGIPNYTDLPGVPMDHPVGLTRKDVVGYFADKLLPFPKRDPVQPQQFRHLPVGPRLSKRSAASPTTAMSHDHVLAPFGMDRSGFDAHDDGAPDRARGYKLTKDGFKPAVAYEFEAPFSAGALVSTPGDLLKYRQGEFGPKTSQQVRDLVLTRVPMSDGSPNPYALGCLVVTSMDGHVKITHAGDIFGFAADYAYYPDDDLTIAITTNNQGASFPPITIEHKLARLFLGLPEPRIVNQAVPAELGGEALPA